MERINFSVYLSFVTTLSLKKFNGQVWNSEIFIKKLIYLKTIGGADSERVNALLIPVCN